MKERAEQTFFEDPALDRALAMVMTLAAELYVTRDRLRVMEAVLVERGVLECDELERFEVSEAERADWDADRDAFVKAIMENVRGTQVSKGVV